MRSRVPALTLPFVLLAAPAAAGAQATGQWSVPTRAERADTAAMRRSPAVPDPGPLDPRLAGAWDVWIQGAVTYRTDGRTVYQRYEPGAAMNRLEIAADGRYRWGEHRGRLEEVRPWHAQDGRRYWRVTHAGGTEYDLYRSDGDELVVLFGGVGGHAATGTRLSGAGATAAPATFRVGDRVEVEWSGRWFGGRVLQARDGRYEVSYDGYDRSWNEWVPPARLRRPAPAGGSAATPATPATPAMPAMPAMPATPKTPTTPTTPTTPATPTTPTTPAPAAPAPTGNPLGVEWRSGTAAAQPAQPAQPTPGNALGVEWRSGSATGSSRPATAGGLEVEWRTGAAGAPSGGAPGATPPAPQAPAPQAPAPPPPPAAGPTDAALAAALADRWLYRAVAFTGDGAPVSETRGVSGSLVFRDDGRYEQALSIGGIMNAVNGTFRVEGDRVLTTYRWRGEPVTDVLVAHLAADGDTLTLVRQGTPTAYYTLERVR